MQVKQVSSRCGKEADGILDHELSDQAGIMGCLLSLRMQVKQVFLKYSVEADRILADQQDTIRRQQEAAATGTAPVTMVKYGLRDELPLRFRDCSTMR